MEKYEIERKRHGYLYLPRQAKLLSEVLGSELFGFYIELAMSAIWDRRNKNFGKVIGTQKTIGETVNMTQSTISRHFFRLECLNRYLVIRHKESIVLGFFPLFLQDIATKMHSISYADLDELYAEMHRINVEMQDKHTEKMLQRLYSSSNSNSFEDSQEELSKYGGE